MKLDDKTIMETSESIQNIDDNKQKHVQQNKYKFDIEQMLAPLFVLQGATTMATKTYWSTIEDSELRLSQFVN